MPRTLPANVATTAQAPGYQAGYAVEVLTASPIRVTDCPNGVTISANVFAYGFLQLGAGTYDEHPAVSVALGNAANDLTSVDLADPARGALDGVTLNVYEVHWDSGGNQLGAVTLLSSAIVVAYVADEGTIQLTAQSALELSAGQVGRICSRNCMFVFKGARCGYAGANTSCAHTLAACTTNGNTAKFGGFQTMPTLDTKLSYYVVNYVPAAYRFGTTVPQSTPTPVGSPTRRMVFRYTPTVKTPPHAPIIPTPPGEFPVAPPPPPQPVPRTRSDERP